MEEAVKELTMAKLTVRKLDETFDTFQSHAFSISSLSEQWRSLKGSFAIVESSLLNRVKEIEGKATVVDERSRDLEVKEKELIERFKEKETAIDVRTKALEVKEKELTERFKRRSREIEGKATVIDERSRDLEVKEKETAAIDVRSKALEVKEKELTVQFERCSREIESTVTVVAEKWRDLEVKEKELMEHFKEKATAIDVRSKALEVKEKEMYASFDKARKEFSVECKEKKLDFDKRLKEFELKEKKLNERLEELKVLEKREKEVDELVRVLASKERKLNDLIDEYIVRVTGVDKRRKEIDVKEKKILRRSKDLDLKEKDLDDKFRGCELRMNENCRFRCELDSKEREIKELGKMLELKEKDLEDKFRGCELRMNENCRFRCELDDKEREIRELGKMLELKEKDLADKFRGCELRMKENDQYRRELDSKESEIEERSKMLELREKEMNEQCEALELIKRENDERSKMLELREKEMNEQCEALELIKRENDERSKMLESRERELKQDSKECEMNGNYIRNKLHTLCREMDANGLISYLDEHVNDHKELHDEVLDALRLASNPAKLVLDVCKTSHEPHWAKLVINYNQTSCIFLLELLMKLEPEITPDVSNEARIFTDVLRGRLGKCDTRGNFRFLMILAAFKLSGFYEVEVIAEHLIRLYSEENIFMAEKHGTLCNVLGIASNIPDIIQNLIDKHQPLEGMRLAHAFELFHKFPPVPLLKSYLSCTFSKAEKVLRRGDPSKEAQIKFLTTKIGAINFVVSCIKKYDLMYKYPTQLLENQCLKLKREKLGLIRIRVSSLDKKRDPDSNDGLTSFRAMKNEVRNHFLHSPETTSGSILDTRAQSMSRNKRPRLSVIQRHEPVDPNLIGHPYTPVGYWGGAPNYPNSPCWEFYSRQIMHHP